jgi:hypothetical protein
MSPAGLNGFVRFAERRNLVSARVPSRFTRSLLLITARLLFIVFVVGLVAHSSDKREHYEF